MSKQKGSASYKLTNEGDRKCLSFESLSNNSEDKRILSVDIDDELENQTIFNFLNSGIKSIRYVRVPIGNNKFTDCVELKNSGNLYLNIISDDCYKYFGKLLNYINDNRINMYEKYLFDIICKYPLDKIIFKLSNNSKNSEVELLTEDNKRTLIYHIPYNIGDLNKRIIDEKEIELIQNTINNYFVISGCELNYINDESTLGIVFKLFLHTDKAEIVINDRELYYGLELYFGIIMQQQERKWLYEREESFRQEALKNKKKNKNKPKLRILVTNNNNSEE